MACGIHEDEEKTEYRFPDCFPPNFAEDILPKNIKPASIEVFRVCKYGKIDKQAFLSTFEEVQLGLRPPGLKWNSRLKDPGTYATSCSTDLEQVIGVMDVLQGYHPKAFLCAGVASSELGPVQRTSERKENAGGHVDWWLFKGSDPSPSFRQVEE